MIINRLKQYIEFRVCKKTLDESRASCKVK